MHAGLSYHGNKDTCVTGLIWCNVIASLDLFVLNILNKQRQNIRVILYNTLHITHQY